MTFLSMIISGFVVGLLARALKPGNDHLGFLMTTLLGIAGAVIAGLVGQAMHFYEPGEPAGWIASILGAVILLVVAHAVTGRRRTW